MGNFCFSGKKKVDPQIPVGASASEFGVTLDELNEANSEKDTDWLRKHGGVAGVAALLHTDTNDGIDSKVEGGKSLEARQHVFGANRFKDVSPKNFFVLWFNNFKDPIIILLVVAALISTVLGVAITEERENSAWSEGIAIWVAVGVVTFVAALNDWKKDRQFQELNKQNDIIEVKAIRDGVEQMISSLDVVAGDVLVLDTGDKVVADCIYIHGHDLIIDESSLTGESDPIKKNAQECWCRSGTKVTEGSGRVLVVAVGPFSEWGKTLAMVVRESPDTPLQEKLADLAKLIGKIGVAFAIICFIALLIRWCIENSGFPISEFAKGPLQFFMFSVTIVVVAVPEGLPLAVTISLGYSMKKMMKDNNFVRVLAACETMGGATAICSDKTGTLTENRMTVVEGWFSGIKHDEMELTSTALKESVKQHIVVNASVNSKAFLVEDPETGATEFGGNRTECALLVMVKNWGFNYKEIRDQHEEAIEKVYGFSSERKMASVLLRTEGQQYRLHNKGAAEIVLARCSHYVNAEGEVVPLTDAVRSDLAAVITIMASSGLRTLGLAYRDLAALPKESEFEQPPEEDLTLSCVVGIKDPVRKEVPAAVRTCQSAGIFVRMVTGDNIHTAKHIARECGILTEDGLALEGPIFRNMLEDQILELLPRLQVLARSSPHDKYTLVNLLKRRGDVVAVTGDGTNDAPALKEADVGLAMGIAGTEVAKEAADIVILDDNFNSIVKSVLWGRNTFNSIRKFLQFQLTVNVVALVVAFVSAVTSGQTPLNILQLLWVNLIMDSMGALALATELPSPDLLNAKPHGRTERLINKKMLLHIFTQGFYQMFWVFLIFYGAPTVLNGYELPSDCQYFSNSPGYSNGVGKNLCCTQGQNCLDTQGGIYLAGEIPICSWTGNGECDVEEPEADNICGDNNGECQRYNELHGWYDTALNSYEDGRDDQQQKTNSIVFNVFIFCQIFNMFNARKINNELNIFAGILKSTLFLVIAAIMVLAQIAIMEGIPGVFKVDRQTWDQWLFAVAVGLGSLPVAFITKLIARAVLPYISSKDKVMEMVPSRRAERQNSKRSEISIVASANELDQPEDIVREALGVDDRPTLGKSNSKRWSEAGNNSKKWNEPQSSYARNASFGRSGSKKWEMSKSGSKRWDEENMGSRRWDVTPVEECKQIEGDKEEKGVDGQAAASSSTNSGGLLNPIRVLWQRTNSWRIQLQIMSNLKPTT